jgi:hypothetical protein
MRGRDDANGGWPFRLSGRTTPQAVRSSLYSECQHIVGPKPHIHHGFILNIQNTCKIYNIKYQPLETSLSLPSTFLAVELNYLNKTRKQWFYMKVVSPVNTRME